jgi:hypothetical protein
MSFMGDSGVTIPIGDCLPYLELKFKEMIGKDPESLEAAAWLSSLHKTALIQAKHVYCVGMHSPLPFDSIYQPTRLRVAGSEETSRSESFYHSDDAIRSMLEGRRLQERSISIQAFLANPEDAIIYAGPGWGKTTFLHYIFRRFASEKAVLPVLITLRRPTAVQDLERFVETASKIQSKQHKSRTLLLVDGYDELSLKDRRRVSEALLKYQALGLGHFLLSCREYYQVFQLAAREVRIDGFTLEDKYRFVRAFLSAYESKLDAKEVVDDFEARGFSEFLSHPLMLALACILKTSRASVQSESATRLLERALDVLCYRWDEQKGLDRHAVTPLDGKDRIQVLKRIAYVAKSPHVPQHRAEEQARKQLDLLTFDRVDARQVLMETARFYGILVPCEEGYEFVHRTLHDFLAAQFWVETGEFAKVEKYEWNARTAYAACRMHDATEIIEAALASEDGLPAVAEILANSPSFEIPRISEAIIRYFSNPVQLVRHNEGLKPKRFETTVPTTPTRVTGSLKSDFIRLGSPRFLNRLIERCCSPRKEVTDIIAGYCILEIFMRGQRLEFITYEKAIKAFETDRFTFDIVGVGQVQLGFVNPNQPKRPVLKF